MGQARKMGGTIIHPRPKIRPTPIHHHPRMGGTTAEADLAQVLMIQDPAGTVAKQIKVDIV